MCKSAQNYFCERMSLFSFSFADTMLSLRLFFQVIPHETAVARFAAEGHRQAAEIPAAPALWRPIGRPRGNVDVSLFAWTTVSQLVEKVPAQVVPPPKAKKQYKKWEPQHQQMALDIANESGTDRLAVSVLWELFPKVSGSLFESHI